MRWRGLRRSGSGSGVSAPPDAADSPPVAGGPPGERRGNNRRAGLRSGAGGDAGAFDRGAVPRSAAVGGRLVYDLDAAADEHVVESEQHRVGQARCAFRQLAGRRRRARLLHPQRAEEGRTAAEEPAGGRAEPAANQPPQSQAAPWPPPITPVFPHPLPGEGVWKPTGPPVDGGPPVLVTTFRPELDYPQIVAYVAWFDHTRTEIGYYPGRYEPPDAAVRGPMMVPDDQRSRLLADLQRRLHLRGRR